MRKTQTFSHTEHKYTHKSEAYTDDGLVWRWVSNDHCVPLDAAEKYGIPVNVQAQTNARNADMQVFKIKYIASQPAEPSAEERFEARAAHGPGVELVDVISGRRFTT